MILTFPWPLVDSYPPGITGRNPLARASTRFYWYISGVKSLGILERRLRANPSVLGEPKRPLLYDLLSLRQRALFLAPPFSHPEIYYTLLLAALDSSWHIYSKCIIIRAHARIRVCVHVNALININVWRDINDGEYRQMIGKSDVLAPLLFTQYYRVLSSLRENCLANQSR